MIYEILMSSMLLFSERRYICRQILTPKRTRITLKEYTPADIAPLQTFFEGIEVTSGYQYRTQEKYNRMKQ